MTKPQISPVERAEFWRFWKWQYTCRNTRYIEAYRKYENYCSQIDKISKERTVTENDVLEFGIFCRSCEEKYGWGPEKNPKHDSDSEKILRDIYNRKLNKKITGYVPYQHNIDIWGLENGNTRYTIDFNKPLDQVLAEVKSIYKQESLGREARKGGMSPSSKQFWEILAERDEYFLNSSDEGFRIDWEIRAIGLWLWDFINSHNVKVREAIRELNKIIDLDKAGLGTIDKKLYPESTYRKISRYFKLTDSCIKSMKVLPMSS